MKLSSACIWKKRGYLWKKEAWSCLCSSDAGRGRVMATLVALGRAVPVLHIPDCQDILLNNTMKTNAPSYSSASFPGDCMYSGTEVWKWDGKQKVCKPDLQKTSVFWNVGGSNIKLFVMYYLVWSEKNELSRNDCSSDAFIKAKSLENTLSVAVW